MPWPTPTASPSPQPNPGLWQLAQDCADVTERRGAKYSFFPRRAFFGRVRIFFRERDCRGSAIQGLEGVEPARRLLCDLDLAAFTDDGCAETDRAEADSANTGRCDCGGEDGIT